MTSIVNMMLCFVRRYRCAKNRFSRRIEAMVVLKRVYVDEVD